MARYAYIIILALAAMCGLTGCGVVFDDLEPCRTGVELRFLYDYNLDEANAFPSQVDCLTLHVYDSDGRFVTSVTETSDILASEDYRLRLSLPAGRYRTVAYGGIACGEASFAHVSEPGPGAVTDDIVMALKPGEAGGPLHHHFHGVADITVEQTPDNVMCQAELHMSKTTNDLRILLVNTGGKGVDGNAFDFRVEDVNSAMDWTNTPLPGLAVTRYDAWAKGSTPGSTARAGGDKVAVGYAELSVPRLMYSEAPVLYVTNRASGRTVVKLPLGIYLPDGQSERLGYTPQEYLDRRSRWTVTLLLDSDHDWASAFIYVDGWKVNIRDIDF